MAIGMQLFVHIAQRWGYFDAGRHRKRQTVGLPGLVVRVLPDNQHAHRIQRRQQQAAQGLWRVDVLANNQVLLQQRQQPLSDILGEK